MHCHDAGCFVHTFPLFCSMRWYACHAYLCHPLALYESLHACVHVHVWVLLASVSSIPQHNEAMDIQSKPTLSLADTTFCSFSCLVCLFICLLAFMLIYFIPLSHALCIFSFHCLSAGFLSLPLHVHIWSEDAWSLGTISQAQAKRARTQACRYEPSGCKQLV